jgi:hypothetical protein
LLEAKYCVNRCNEKKKKDTVTESSNVRFEVFTAVTMKNGVFWVVMLWCTSAPIFVTLMKEAPGSSETSVLTRATWRNNPEDTILHRIFRFPFHHNIAPAYQGVSEH